MTRRLAGTLSARVADLHLELLDDPRAARGKRWPLPILVLTLLAGLVAGSKSLLEIEALTEEMSGAARRWLGIARRIPDTTLRTVLCRLSTQALRGLLHKLIYQAHRRKALAPASLPFGIVALDGKSTALGCPPGNMAQKQDDNAKHRVVRTVTCTLVSSTAKPCIDAIPIPAATNEMGHFEHALRALHTVYGKTSLFRLVSYDAGACSVHNAGVVKELNLDYLFAFKASQPTMLHEMQRLLERRTAAQADACSDEARGSGTWVRRVYLSEEMAAWPDWEHLSTVLRVESEQLDADGKRIAYENRYFGSSLALATLTPTQWLQLVRSHWAVENENHHTFDTAFQEDDKPWIEADEKGMLNVLVLRRIAYTIMAMFRSVTQRSEERRRTPWRDLLRWFYNAWISLTTEQVRGLRRREIAVTP